MKTVISLFVLQQRAKLKNIMRQPLMALLTIVGVVFFVGIFALILITPKELLAHTNVPLGPEYIAWMSVGMMGFMFLSQALQSSKSALFFVEDSYYLFTMPLTQRQVLWYLVLQSKLQSLMFGAFVVFMCASLSMSIAPMSLLVILTVFLSAVLGSLSLLLLKDYYYLIKIVRPEIAQKFSLGLKILGGVFIALALFILYQHDFNVMSFTPELLTSKVLEFIPIIGWMKAAVVGAFASNMLVIILNLVYLLIWTGLSVLLLINVKGEFYEEAMLDSETFSESYRAAKTGKSSMGKIHSATEAFKMNEMAFYSKEMLLLKKTRQYLKREDLMIIVMYLFISYLSGMNYSGYTNLMFIWLFISMMRSSIGSELKSPYIYLAPGNPRKKMMALVLPLLITPTVMILVSYIAGAFVFKATLLEVITNIVRTLSMLPLLLAGNVFALRLLKGQTNIVVENLLRMVIMFIVLIPTLILTVILLIQSGGSIQMTILVDLALSLFSLLGAFAVFYFCAPMLNGGDVPE